MKCNLLARGAAAILAASVFILAPASAQPLSIEDLTRQPLISGASLSPDGRYLVALVASRGEKSETAALSVWDLDNPDKAPVVAEAPEDIDFMGAFALHAGKIVVAARKPFTGETHGCIESNPGGRTHQYKLLVTDISLRKFDDPFAIRGIGRGMSAATRHCLELAVTGSVRDDLLTLDPDHIVIAELNKSSFRTEYKRYNLRTGATSVLFSDTSSRPAGLLDPRDAAVWSQEGAEAHDGTYRNDVWLRDANSGAMVRQEALSTRFDDRRTVRVVGRDEESGHFYVVTDQFSDKQRVYFYDAAAQAYDADPLFAHPEFSALGVVLGRSAGDFNQLLGFVYGAEVGKVWWIDPEFEAIQSQLDTIFADMNVQIADWSDDRSRVLFSVERSDRPMRYFILRNKSQIVSLGDSAPWIDVAKTGRTELVYYNARDGLRIPAFLTKPAGWKAGDKPAPAVVLPHGGPWARDTSNWDPTGWVQFFASRGYAVLQPQYRGSAGFGHALWLAGDAEWGQKMQDDKDDGALWMVSEKIADPGKLVIFGYSYGGFAAFAASVRPGGPFKCAIAGAGVSDLKRLGGNWSENRQQRLYQGRTVKGMSPMDNTSSISMPILIFHGDRDVRVALSHSTGFYNRVKDRVPSRLVVIKEMPHSLPWRVSWQREALGAVENFLKTDCGL